MNNEKLKGTLENSIKENLNRIKQTNENISSEIFVEAIENIGKEFNKIPFENDDMVHYGLNFLLSSYKKEFPHNVTINGDILSDVREKIALTIIQLPETTLDTRDVVIEHLRDLNSLTKIRSYNKEVKEINKDKIINHKNTMKLKY